MTNKETHAHIVESNIIQIMLVRRAAVLQGDMTEEEVDTLINETGREWMARTENMSEGELMFEMLMQAVKVKSSAEKAKNDLNGSK